MQPIKINEISVSNYKGIDSLKFSPRDINIIVGPNNTGKSSLLNAISLCLYSFNEFNNENKGLFDKERLYPLHRQIYENNKNTSKIHMNLGDSRNKINLPFELEIVYGKEFPRRRFSNKAFIMFIRSESQRRINEEMREFNGIDRNDRNIDDYLKNRKDEIKEEINSEIHEGCSNTLFFKLKLRNKIIMESYFENLRGKSKYRRSSPRRVTFRTYFKDSDTLIMLKRKYDFNSIFRSQLKKFDLNLYFKELSQTPNFYNVLDRIKEKLNYIYDIREIEGHINIVNIGSDGSKIFIPFELMGDGFQSILISTVLFELLPKGIVILEEPENFLHPGYIEFLVEVLLQKSENYQYFFSTHSLDFIKILIEKAKKKKCLEKILLLRLSKLNNKINREILLEDKILEELEGIKVDLRGY